MNAPPRASPTPPHVRLRSKALRRARVYLIARPTLRGGVGLKSLERCRKDVKWGTHTKPGVPFFFFGLIPFFLAHPSTSRCSFSTFTLPISTRESAHPLSPHSSFSTFALPPNRPNSDPGSPDSLLRPPSPLQHAPSLSPRQDSSRFFPR